MSLFPDENDLFNLETRIKIQSLNNIELNLKETLEDLKELKDDSAAKEFCEHNIKKAIKWLGKINGNGNPEITK